MRSVTTLIVSFFFFSNAFGQPAESRLIITPLDDNFYVYTSYGEFNGAKYPANGMYLVTSQGVVLFDCPWDTTQFQPLLDSIKLRHNTKVVLCIATHFHEDRIGGLEYYRSKGIKTYTSQKTDSLSKLRNKKRAEFIIHQDTTFSVGGYSFRTYFPGEGHSPDNIVIWFQKERVLYGGCLVKSVEDNNLGNLDDANQKTYAQTIRNLIKNCKLPRYIITGHNNWHSSNSLQHTLQMAEKLELQGKG